MRTEPLPYAVSDFRRSVARVSRITFKNRFVESVPVLNERQVSAISRPALRKVLEVGDGPVRSLFSSPGLFSDDLFVVSGAFLYRVDVDLNVFSLGQISTNIVGAVSWAPIANIGDTPARLFFAEGGVLWLYTKNGEASGRLQMSGLFVNTDVVRIGSIYYQFTSGSVDAGTPNGSSGNPWLVNVAGAVPSQQLARLFAAINDSGVDGVDYSTALVAHPEVIATRQTATELVVNARDYGVVGNSIVTTETSANAAWVSATLTGGGAEQLRQVRTPNDEGAISVAMINSYVIVVPIQNEQAGTIGQFYWIEPGDTFIDPINFANAERAPDEIHQVSEFGNLFWLYGSTTTEPWLTSPDPNAPIQRFDSILFDRGSWPGTAIQVKDSNMVIDPDGAAFKIQGGQERISRPDIEEKIRKAIQRQQNV
jgi:hypothetical protein